MVNVMLYPCMSCISLLMALIVLCVECLTEFVNCLMKQFAICLGVILLFNVIELFSVVVCAQLDRLCMVFQRVCVCVVPVIPVCV